MLVTLPANTCRQKEFNRSWTPTMTARNAGWLAVRSKCLQIKAFHSYADTAVTCAVILSESPVSADNGPGHNA